MLSPYAVVANRLRTRRLKLGLSLRSLGRSLGCSHAYLVQVEQGRRPLSRDRARGAEVALGLRQGTLGLEIKRGRPRLDEKVNRLLRVFSRAPQGARPGTVEKPRHPRSEWGVARANPLWPIALHGGEMAQQRVRRLEELRRGQVRFWHGFNRLRFDSWSEKDLVLEVALRALDLVGLSPARAGCSVTVVCGQTGRCTQEQAYPAFVLEHRGATIAWYVQRCVRTGRGHRWPDNLLIVSQRGLSSTLVVELDGPEFHRSLLREEARDRELGVPVLHVHPDVVRASDGLERILDWAVSRHLQALAG